MKYTPGTVAKAIAAFVTTTLGSATAAAAAAAGDTASVTIDLSHLTAGQWATAVGMGLVAFGGVFGIPNKDTKSASDKVTEGLQQAVRNQAAAEAAKAAAASELDKIHDMTGKVIGAIPIIGDDAKAVYDMIPTPKF